MRTIIAVLTSIFLVSSNAFAIDLLDVCTGVIASGGTPFVCTQDESNLVMDESSMSVDRQYGISKDNAVGQSISYGSEWVLSSIEINFGSSTASCICTVRIGASADLTTYMEEWTGVSPADGASLEELVSLDHDTYDASTTYYIGILETSGSCYLYQDDTSPPYAGGSYILVGTGWAMGAADTSRDNHINVYQCE